MARGGLFKLVGQGVGLAAEYSNHRKQQNQARHAAHSDGNEVGARQQSPAELPADLPPAYAESARESEQSLGGNGRRSTSEKRTPSPFEGDSDFDSDSSSLLSIEDDEGDWELDELEREEAITPPESSAASTVGPPSYEESEASKQQEHENDLVRQVIATSTDVRTTSLSNTQNSDVEAPKAYQPLPYPVILPQRRPRKKARGFIRAYAPVLENCGINQQTFLSFLKNFHKASQASPIFPVIQVSAAIAGTAPSVIAMAVCTVAQIAAGVGEEIQGRVRTNGFLDRMNEELFKPHGLYAMIVKYKSDVEVEQETTGRQGPLSNLIKAQQVDLSTNQSIAKYMQKSPAISSGSGRHGLSERMQTLRLASDTTRGALELPEAAPLIFPGLDYKLEHDGPETFKDKTNDAKRFLADYLDRRAQMQYAMQDPNSSLVVPESQRGFGSKLADPSHPMYSGGLIALLSGGKANSRQAKSERRLERHEERRERAMARDVRQIERGQGLRNKREERRARRYGDDYRDELAARTGRLGRQGGFGPLGLVGALRGGSRFGAEPMPNTPAPHARYGASPNDGSSSRESRASYDTRSGAGSSRGGYNQRRAGRRGRGGAVKRLMREDVLYLMIVNLPTEAELEEAELEEAELEEARQELALSRSED